jgi:hypothetical protein
MSKMNENAPTERMSPCRWGGNFVFSPQKKELRQAGRKLASAEMMRLRPSKNELR